VTNMTHTIEEMHNTNKEMRSSIVQVGIDLTD
jgi:hypothetical protein